MSWVDSKLAAFDLETTGVDPFTARPVTFAACELEEDRLRTMTEIVNPGIPIPPEASAIHGVTDALASGGWGLGRAVEYLTKRLCQWSDQGTPVVGMNLSYDLTIIDSLSRELGGIGLVDLGWHGPVLDCMVLDRAFGNPYRRGPRTLQALCEHHRVEATDLHSAKGDCISCLRLAKRLAQKYKGIRLNTPEWLHAHQIEWKREQMQSLSDYRVERGQEPIPIHEQDWPIQRPPVSDTEVISQT